MPKETKEYQVSEESDLYHTINHRVKSFTELLRLKENLIDHQNSLEERRNKIVEMNKEHYGEDPYAIQELDAMYIEIDQAFSYWLKKMDKEILELETTLVSDIWRYKTNFDEAEKRAQQRIHDNFVNNSEAPF
jgi:hypothetical protein